MKILSFILCFVLMQTALKAQEINKPPIKTEDNTVVATRPATAQQVPIKKTEDKPTKSTAVTIVKPATASSVSLKEAADKRVQSNGKPIVQQ